MNLPPLPLTNGALLVDNGFIEALTTCPRKLQYDKLMRRIPTAERPPLNFGTAGHLVWDWRYRNCKNNRPTADDEQKQIDILGAYFRDNPQPEDDHRQLNFAIDLFVKQYNSRYQVEPFNLLSDAEGNVMSEMSFALPLFVYEPLKLPVIYIGRIDLPVQWDSQIIIIDHKTSSMLGDHYFDSQRVSSQYEGYCWAFEQISKQPVSGFCINAVRSKAQPAKPKLGMDNWWSECYGRHKEYLRPGQLDEWKNNTIQHIKEFFWHYEQDYMPQRKKACTMYGKCQYYDVCYLPADSRERELQSDKFQTDDWSPLKNINK